jgi:membrane-bound serine protease (ClpP class)
MVRESISLSAEKALETKLIDLIASSRNDLLKKLDGRRVMRDGRETTLQLTGAKVIEYEMGTRQKILNIVSNPNVAYVLMMLGVIGLFFELSNPGVILPGVIGAISLLLAFYAFHTLPINYAGILLILLAVVLFIAEINIVSHGMLSVGGVVALFFGSLLLFDSPEPYLRLSWSVILVTVVMTTLFFTVAIAKSLKVHREQPAGGMEGLVGEEGRVEADIMPEGKIFVHGELWDAFSDEEIRKGEKAIVVAVVERMRLKVKRP